MMKRNCRREFVKALLFAWLVGGMGPGPGWSQMAAGPSPNDIQAKIQKVQEAAEKRGKEGRPPIAAMMAMQRFEPLMKAGKYKEADELLDRALGYIDRAPGKEEPLEKKLIQVHKGVKAVQAKGEDPMLIGMVMSQFEPLVKQGKGKEAEKILDTALKLLKNKDPRKVPEAKPYVRVQDKIREVQQKAPQWAASGGDLSKIDSLMKKLDPLMKEGKLQEAEALLDRAIAQLQGGAQP